MKVNFSKPHYDWIDFTLEDNEEYIFFIFSSVWYDTLEDLASALIVLQKSFEVSYNVIFFCEPEEFHFEFSKSQDVFNLKITEVIANGEIKKKVIFKKNGDYNSICVPFWRGLRKLSSYFDCRQWSKGFPTKSMDILTKLIKSEKRPTT